MLMDHPRLADAPKERRIAYARALLVAFWIDAVADRWREESAEGGQAPGEVGRGLGAPAGRTVAVHESTCAGVSR